MPQSPPVPLAPSLTRPLNVQKASLTGSWPGTPPPSHRCFLARLDLGRVSQPLQGVRHRRAGALGGTGLRWASSCEGWPSRWCHSASSDQAQLSCAPSNAQESWSGTQLCAPGGPSVAEVLPYTLTRLLGLPHGATTKSQQFKERPWQGWACSLSPQGLEAPLLPLAHKALGASASREHARQLSSLL